MALTIDNPEVERLAADVARLAGETKTEAIRRALIERRARLMARGDRPVGSRSLIEFLEREIWPFIPPESFGRPLSRGEEDKLLGYGPEASEAGLAVDRSAIVAVDLRQPGGGRLVFATDAARAILVGIPAVVYGRGFHPNRHPGSVSSGRRR